MGQKTAQPKSRPAVAAMPLPPLASPLPSLKIRQRDPQGAGHFGASRGGGKRRHLGIDLIAPPGTPVTSVLDGTVTRIGWPYGDDLSFRYVEVTSAAGLVTRYFYVAPEISPDETVTAGTTCLGTVQDLTQRYRGIANHLHLEMRQADDPARRGHHADLYKGYRVIDPTPLLPKRA